MKRQVSIAVNKMSIPLRGEPSVLPPFSVAEACPPTDTPREPIEHQELSECAAHVENIGWTLGNECPYRCTQCYSMSARRKGRDLNREMVEHIVDKLVRLRVKTVNLGGNEPLFTNGIDPRATLLPFIVESLTSRGIRTGITTSGLTLVHLAREHQHTLGLLNDVDVSLDSPDGAEHDRNRGAALFGMALRSLEICQALGLDRSIILCAMNWNFSEAHVDRIVALSKAYGAHIRINPLKPVEPVHMQMVPDAEAFFRGFSRLMTLCRPVDLGDPVLASACGYDGQGCPCGRTSLRIHSITPEGTIPVSPCVYMHEYKTGDLLVDDLDDIIASWPFRLFRKRNAHPEKVEGCEGCLYLEPCRGGCAARAYLHALHERGERSLFHRDPYCLRDAMERMDSRFPVFPHCSSIQQDRVLVHKDYLCTWIGSPL